MQGGDAPWKMQPFRNWILEEGTLFLEYLTVTEVVLRQLRNLGIKIRGEDIYFSTEEFKIVQIVKI